MLCVYKFWLGKKITAGNSLHIDNFPFAFCERNSNEMLMFSKLKYTIGFSVLSNAKCWIVFNLIV